MAEDVVKITVWVPDEQALKTVLSSAKVNLDCGSPKRDESGNFRITLYASSAEAQKITALPYRSEVDSTYGEYLAARQQEVATGDRFQGGKVKPEGLGTKR
ncbi:MAG TPA: hypothetical protein VIX37_08695 [Candidatus Sulfotelmatobacter sp.]